MKTENTHIKGCSFSSTAYDKFQENGRQNIFEEVIDNLMAEGLDIPSDFLEDHIPTEEKREFILNCLIPEEGPTINEMFKNIRCSKTRSQHLKNSIETIKEFIKVGKQEVKKYGEVYTPIDLVNEMLDTLPKDVWSNPDLKWLDPANGMGNFPLVVIVRLMKGLKEWEPDVEKRYKHIIENMVYVSELQPRNAFIYLCLVDPNDEYDVNLYCGSFLDDPFNEHMKGVWELDKFDIVVGNPPYQMKKEGFKKTQPIWNKFVISSINILNKNGYLSMVHPGGWRSPSGVFRGIYDKFMERNLSFLSINDFNEGKKVFGVGTNFDFYLLENNKNYTNTIINTSDNEEVTFDIKKINFIPNGKFDEFVKIIDGSEKVDILYSRSKYGTDKKNTHRVKDSEFKYPCVYTITKKSGINLFFSNTKEKGHFNIPKVIWSNGLGTYPILDMNGEYGLTQFSYGIVDRIENLENIKKALESEKFLNLMNYCKYTNNKYDHKVISTFKKDFWREFI